MRKEEIKVGGRYHAVVNGNLTTVLVTSINQETNHYNVINQSTGRSTVFRSAAKFRRKAMTQEERVKFLEAVNPVNRILNSIPALQEPAPEVVLHDGDKVLAAMQINNCSAEQANLEKAVDEAIDEEYPHSPKVEETPATSSNSCNHDWYARFDLGGSSICTKCGIKRVDLVPVDSKLPIHPDKLFSIQEDEIKQEQNTEEGEQSSDPTSAAMEFYGGVAETSDVMPSLPAPVSGLAARLAARMANRKTPDIKGKLTPTDEQRAIIDLAYGIMTGKISSDVAVFEAGAGTGKTATFRMLADILPGTGQYVTFTAALTKESQVKFHGTKVQCNTIHSLAFRAIGHKYADRLNGPRIRSERVAQMLGIKTFTIQRTTIDEATGDHVTKPHNLAPGFLAGQVMAAIRKFSMSADKEVTADHFKYIDGIDLPGADGRRSYTCNNQVREYLLPFAQAAWKDLCNVEGHLPFIHDHYVKMWQLDNPAISASYLLVDECFPSGTLIPTDRGVVPIEQIVENKGDWYVLAMLSTGRISYTRVLRAYKTPNSKPLVEITYANRTETTTIRATANHPIWVSGTGWKPAGLICPGDTLHFLRYSNTNWHSNMSESCLSAQAQQGQEPTDRTTSPTENFKADESCTDGDSQSYGTAGNTSESFGHVQGEGNILDSKRGQRNRIDKAPSSTTSGTGPTAASLAMEPRICVVNWATEKLRISTLLQDRHSLSQSQDSSGSRRQMPRMERQEGTGCQESFMVDEARVVRTSLIERRSADGPGGGCEESDRVVYTLQTEAGNYFANGILVKNCQDVSPVMLSIFEQQQIPKFLVGDSAQSIYEWRGAVNAMTAFPGAPRLFLSQSFRFGQAIADVANAVLETLEEATPLRLKGFDKINSVVAPMTEYKAVLCRTNAVAVGRLLAAIAEGKSPFLVGGGADVIAFVKAAKDLQQGLPTSHPELACFESWAGVQAYVKEDEGEDLKLLVNLIDAFGCDPIISALENMPAEKDADLIISTAHKSKGREWTSVKIERDFPTLSKSDDAAKKLLYVAVTRAKEALDISECPFFTGQDALDLSDVIKPADYQPVMTPAPVLGPAQAVGKFSWSKDQNTGKWGVGGPSGFEGKEVTVERKDGSTSTVLLGKVLYSGANFTKYEVRK